MLIQASFAYPPAFKEVYEERVNGPDKGVVNAWLAGIAKHRDQSDIAMRAMAGELPILPYRGGVEKAVKSKDKVGSLLYLAMWQGLRGEDLRIDLESEPKIVCSRTNVPVTFTLDLRKLLNSTTDEE